MATQQQWQLANNLTLKRSFTAVTKSTPPSPDTSLAPNPFKLPAIPSRLQGDRHISFFPKRRQPSDYQLPNMPVAAGPQAYQSQFPSFMSVYSVNENNVDKKGLDAEPNTELATTPLNSDACQTRPEEHENASLQTHLQHKHRDSTSTQASESTDSSPTTTISTADSSSLTDPSPSSSPESPVTIIPLSSFSSTRFGIHSLDDLTMSESPSEQQSLSFDRPLTSPSPRKPRNAKGLALNLHSLGDAPQQLLSPSSPAFVKPPLPKARKKPSILSLQTSANPNPTPLARLAFEPPPTPGDARTTVLRHHHSSPQMLFSPDPRGAAAPPGGMQLPAFERSRVSGLSTVFRKPSALKEGSSMGAEPTIAEEESPIKAQLATRSTADIRGDVFDAPASQEDAHSPGYPNGPIAIYEPHVYLYLEPTADEASQFDVILNVAREVKNPFKTTDASKESTSIPAPKTTFDLMDIDRDDIPVPDTAVSTKPFKTAFEFQPFDSQQTPTESSPTTPKPAARKEPEYIHVPWEHNTDISKELMELCEIIDSRTKEGKKVLVHCQQGASRSASLIIAYGIFMDSSLTVNAAYLAAQKKSKWISPNMKLMYALQDFKKDVEKKRQSGGSGLRRGAGRSPTRHRMTLSADFSPKEPPQTAPLPSERDNVAGGDTPTGTPARARGNSTPNFGEISPGPSSAPSSFAWTPNVDKAPNHVGLWSTRSYPSQQSSYSSSGGFVYTPRSSIDTPPASEPTSQPASPPISQGFGSHRTEHQQAGRKVPSMLNLGPKPATSSPSFSSFSSLPRQHATRHVDNVPQTPGLWSPRIQEMTGSSGSALNHSFAFQSTAQDDVPPTPSIMSPRVVEFGSNAFGNAFGNMNFSSVQAAASSFGFSTATAPSGPPPSSEDPRSPAMKGEAPIIRSIDDML